MEKWLIGVDLGGTTIKIAFISNDGDILDKWEIPTDTSDGGRNIVSDIAKSIEQKVTQYQKKITDFKGIGVGAPAFLNMSTGFVYQAVNLGWKNFDLKSELEKKTNLPAIIDNDANVAAIGEMWKGAGDGSTDVLCITLGTGVGGGVIINGEIVHGVNGMAGEIGHITVLPEAGELCNCGKRGCLETVASATGLVRLAMVDLSLQPQSILFNQHSQHGYINSKMIMEAAKQNDSYAVEIVNKGMFYLGLAIANIGNTINPEKIVIGGGVSKAGSFLLQSISKYFKQFALERVSDGADLVIATLGNDAGIIGSAWLAKNKL